MHNLKSIYNILKSADYLKINENWIIESAGVIECEDSTDFSFIIKDDVDELYFFNQEVQIGDDHTITLFDDLGESYQIVLLKIVNLSVHEPLITKN